MAVWVASNVLSTPTRMSPSSTRYETCSFCTHQTPSFFVHYYHSSYNTLVICILLNLLFFVHYCYYSYTTHSSYTSPLSFVDWKEREQDVALLHQVRDVLVLHRERELFIDNILVRIHFIIETIGWTSLAPWELELSSEGSLTSTKKGGQDVALLDRVRDVLVLHITP